MINIEQAREVKTDLSLKTAYAYCRFSSDNQREESIDGQKRAIKYFAQQNGYDIVRVYADRAKSGKSAMRPQFQQMIQDAKQGGVCAVIVYKLDRFSRDTADALQYEAILNENDVELISVMEKLESSPTGNLMKTIIMGMNSFYVENMATDIFRGMKENALQCRTTGGVAPLGYRYDKQQYVVEPKEAEIVQLMFTLYDQGYGYGSIVDELKAQGYRSRNGKVFGKNSLYDILRNERYKGTYTFNKAKKRRKDGSRAGHGGQKPESEIIRIPGGIPAIVDEELWQRVNDKLDSRKRSAGASRAKEPYLLSGIIYCGECGAKMHGNSRYPAPGRDKFVSYRCNRKGNNHDCENGEINRDHVENFVIQELEAHLLHDDILPILTKQLNQYAKRETGQQAQKTERYKLQLDALKANKGNIIDAIAQTGFEDVFVGKLSDIEREEKAIKTKLQQLARQARPSILITEDMVKTYLATLKDAIQRRDRAELKTFIQSYVERVDVYSTYVKVTLKVAFSFGQDSDAYYHAEETRHRLALKWY